MQETSRFLSRDDLKDAPELQSEQDGTSSTSSGGRASSSNCLPEVSSGFVTPRISLVLAGDALEQLVAPGDVLLVRGQGRLNDLGNVGGFMGHVMLVVAPPKCVYRHSEEAHELQAAWPPGDVQQLWKVRTVESTRRERGLHQADMLMFVERETSRLVLVGEMPRHDELVLLEQEAVEVWQSPPELRARLQLDIVAKVLADMKAREANWSVRTAARAVLKSARLLDRPDKAALLEEVQACWDKEPICTSVVIVFWQRYLFHMAESVNSCGLPGCCVKPIDLIMRWMPLKADRGLPGQLLSTMQAAGWAPLVTMPRIFQPMVFHGVSSALQKAQAAAVAEALLRASPREPPACVGFSEARPDAPPNTGNDGLTPSQQPAVH